MSSHGVSLVYVELCFLSLHERWVFGHWRRKQLLRNNEIDGTVCILLAWRPAVTASIRLYRHSII